jgi:hypothetical protein
MPTLDERPQKKTLIAIVDGVVCSMCCGDQKLFIKNAEVSLIHVFDRHRVHVMNQNAVMDVMTLDT